MYSDMSSRTMACSSSNRNSASERASSVLPTPVGPRNRNEPTGRFASWSPARARRHRAGRPLRVLEPGAGAAHRLAHHAHGLVLAHDALVQALLHLHELLDFTF